MADGWSIGEIAKLAGEGLVVVGWAVSSLVYVGRHSEKHNEIDKTFTGIDETLHRIEAEIKTVSCPEECQVRDCRTDKEFPIVKERQDHVLSTIGLIGQKLDHLIEKTARVERLEVKMDSSEKDRGEMNKKLDKITRDLGEISGILKFKG